MLFLCSGCELNSDYIGCASHLYGSWHNNLNFELTNFINGLGLINDYTEQEINSENLRNLYYMTEMFTDANNLFVRFVSSTSRQFFCLSCIHLNSLGKFPFF